MRKKRELKDLISRLAPVVYPAMREEYTHDCCIAAASILKRVFAIYGYRAIEVPTQLEVYNAAMVKALDSQVRIPDKGPARERFFDITGAWGIGITRESQAVAAAKGIASFGGHLIIKVGPYLLDPTIQQCNRPEKKIVLPPMLATRAAEFVRDGTVDLSCGSCVVRYTLTDNFTYRSAPDWKRRTTPFPETVRKIIDRVEQSEVKDASTTEDQRGAIHR
jgi:hypothetical protein